MSGLKNSIMCIVLVSKEKTGKKLYFGYLLYLPTLIAWHLFDPCSSFTILQHLAIWGNLAAFYVINWIFSALPSSGMYTIMFRLCQQPSYWITIFVSSRPSYAPQRKFLSLYFSLPLQIMNDSCYGPESPNILSWINLSIAFHILLKSSPKISLLVRIYI